MEQKLLAATAMAERQLVMVSGRIQAETTASQLKADPELQRRYLGVGSAVETADHPATPTEPAAGRGGSAAAARERVDVKGKSVTESVNVALVGSKFMGRAHSNAWLKVAKFFPVDPQPRMHTVVGRNASELESFAQTWGWEHTSTDWQSAVQAPEIGLVDIATPNDVHAEQAIAALEAGQARRVREAARRHARRRRAHGRGRRGGLGPDVRLVQLPPGARGSPGAAAGRLRRAGPHLPRARCVPAELGRSRHPAVVALPGRHRRLRRHGDLNAHIIDTVRFVTGEEIVTVEGAIEHTFITEREVSNTWISTWY